MNNQPSLFDREKETFGEIVFSTVYKILNNKEAVLDDYVYKKNIQEDVISVFNHKILIKLKKVRKRDTIFVRKSHEKLLIDSGIDFIKIKKADWLRADGEELLNSPIFEQVIYETYLKIYDSFADGFGCCSRFTECSDAGKCINPDQIYARGCYYKKNLESGKIFYGKNKNN